MAVRVDVEFWARDAGKAAGRGDVVVVVDVLRSGTSILGALSNGAKAVLPALSLKEARRLRIQHPGCLLAGERGGRRPWGFDLGNSPLEFTRERVGGKSLVMTTTSGTAALVKSRGARRVLVGAFLNAEAVAESAARVAAGEGVGVSFVLAGDRGGFSLEDFLCAGAIAAEFAAGEIELSDKVEAALYAFRSAECGLTASVARGEHAKRLVKLGFERDIVFSCRLNVLRIVPIYRDGRITV